jgi:hypothetical protein
LKDNVPIVINGQASLAYFIDRKRFDKSISHISRALFYHHYKKKWEHEFIVETPDLFKLRGEDAHETNLRVQDIDRLSNEYFEGEPFLGENPKIFQYQMKLADEVLGLGVKMVFYGGFITISTSSPGVFPANGESQ